MKELYLSHKEIKKVITETYEGESAPANVESHKAFKIQKIVLEAYEDHIKKLPVYVTICNRYGNDENHSYFRGIFRTLEEAIADALEHFQDRAGKYYPNIYEDTFEGSPKLVFNYGDYEAKKIEIIRNRKD